jgi:hypothetical protein
MHHAVLTKEQVKAQPGECACAGTSGAPLRYLQLAEVLGDALRVLPGR